MNRDEIATLMNQSAGQAWGTEAHFQRFADLVAAAEREACAKVCERYWSSSLGADGTAQAIAAAIRARSNT